jgi:hypothetical protein
MKIIITEEQVESLRKIRVLEKYIDHILSEYPWYEGIDSFKVEPFRFRISTGTPKAYEVPLYRFFIKTNDHVQSHHDADSDNTPITDDIDEMFSSLFPKKGNMYTALWVFNYVDP